MTPWLMLLGLRHSRKVEYFTKKNSESFDENWRNGGCFSKFGQFCVTCIFTLAPPSGYALNLKALIKVSKVSWTSQLSYEILSSSYVRKFDKKNFISPKRTPPKSPHHLGLKDCLVGMLVYFIFRILLSKEFEPIVFPLQFWACTKY